MEITNLKVKNSLLSQLNIEKEDLKNTLEKYNSMEDLVNSYLIPNKITFFISALDNYFNNIYTSDGIDIGYSPITQLQETETGDCLDPDIIQMFKDYVNAYKAKEVNDYDIIMQILY